MIFITLQINAIDEFTQIIGYTDKLQLLRALLSYPYINWVSQFFSRTRNAETELYFVDYCREIITYHRGEISEKEYRGYDHALIRYELSAYDRLNRWEEYIAFYEQAVSEGRLQSYSWDRYPIICRKQKRLEAEKNVEHLKRHQQSGWTDEELDKRYAEMERLFEYMKRRYSTGRR